MEPKIKNKIKLLMLKLLYSILFIIIYCLGARKIINKFNLNNSYLGVFCFYYYLFKHRVAFFKTSKIPKLSLIYIYEIKIRIVLKSQ